MGSETSFNIETKRIVIDDTYAKLGFLILLLLH